MNLPFHLIVFGMRLLVASMASSTPPVESEGSTILPLS